MRRSLRNYLHLVIPGYIAWTIKVIPFLKLLLALTDAVRMSSPQSKDDKKSAIIDSNAVESNEPGDVAVGSQEDVVDYRYLRQWNASTLFRSVLFQMILFGA